jgi:hypothetical protein
MSRLFICCCLFIVGFASLSVQALAQDAIPNPVIAFSGRENYEAGGKQWTRYKFAVTNYDAYPAEMFAASPDLAPCGRNTKASRTWVDLFDQSGKRLYGFCAFAKPADLDRIWFAVPADEVPPSWVYIEMFDRKTNTKYRSNLAETSL